MRKKKQSKMISELNVVPYIDVMFVLLIIFMITAPMITHGVKIELPKVSNAQVIETEENQSPLIITIKENGDLFMVEDNKEIKLSLKEIVIKLKSYKKINPLRKSFIRGDSKVEYGKVVKVMNILRSNGVEEIGLITQKI
jgi:biopolymer transport protein TolR